MGISNGGGGSSPETALQITNTTLSGDVQLTSSSTVFQVFDPNESNRNVVAEDNPEQGRFYRISNPAEISNLVFKNYAGSTIATVYPETAKFFVYDETIGWFEWVEGSAIDGVELGFNNPMDSIKVDSLQLYGGTIRINGSILDLNLTAGTGKDVVINSPLKHTIGAINAINKQTLSGDLQLTATSKSHQYLNSNTGAMTGRLVYAEANPKSGRTYYLHNSGVFGVDGFLVFSNAEGTQSFDGIPGGFMGTFIYNGTSWQQINLYYDQITYSNLYGLANFASIAPLLAAANTFTAAQSVTPVALTSDSNSVAIDAALSNNFTHILTEDTTLAAPTNLVDGTAYNFIIKQHASAAKTLAFDAAFLFPDGVDPTITTTLNSVMMVSCIYTTVGGLMCVSSQGFA
jgi:hypothetical protein